MNFSKNSGKKKAAAAAVVCFVAAIAITGTYTFHNYKEAKNENQVAQAEENLTKEKYTVTDRDVDESAEPNEGDSGEISGSSPNDSRMSDDDSPGDSDIQSDQAMNPVEEASMENAANVNFSDDSMILWPVAGTLLMDYSMDHTVYFKTLDQYKYNPALVIAAAENDSVIAGAPGLVKSIDNSAETGTTVNIDLGNGYEAFYGQLQNVAVKTGDYVDAATTLGYVAEPTKYYSSEGTNVYFEMRKDGQPVNPKEYMTDYTE